MRFFVLGAAISALAAVVAAVPFEGNLTPEENKHMKDSIKSMSKAINTKSCDVAKSQVMSLHNMIQDYSVQGHITGERDQVTYVTMEDGDNMVKNLWSVRLDAEKQGRDEANLDSQRRKGGNRTGKGRGGKGRGGKGRGGSRGGRGRGGRGGRSLDEEDSMGGIKLSCASAQKILKVVRDFAPKSVKVGTTPDNKCAYYVYPKEEKSLKSKIRKAVLSV